MQTTLNIQRTLNASLSPLQNVSGTLLSPNGSEVVYAQLFYVGVEQFFCSASSCTQSFTNSTDTWTCSTLQCQCIPNTSFCGAPGPIDLTGTINALLGPLTIACDNNSNCHFQQQTLDSLFGSPGLQLQNCVLGECVTQAVIDSSAASSPNSTNGSSPLSPGVIAGLAVVGGLIGIALAGVIWGWILQRAARKRQFDGGHSGGVDVWWKNVTYLVRSAGADKTILDSVNGHVAAGELMAVLGPSGAGKTTLVDGTGRGISGGEARRVSIGLELVGCPDILICDEPTSGLDSVSAWRVVNVLKEVARGGGGLFGSVENNSKGVAVICSVHQPRWVFRAQPFANL